MGQLQFVSGQMNKLSTFIYILSFALSFLLASKPVVGYTFCFEKQDGLYPSGYNCEHYYECQNSITIIRNCTEGQFDQNELQCKENAACLTPPFPHCSVDCSTHNNGDMFPNPEECAFYFECSWNKLLIRPCAPGLYFNPDLSEPNCDRPENVICATCTSNSTSTTEQPGNSTSELPENTSELPESTSELPESTFSTSESTPTTDHGYETTTSVISTTESELSSIVTPPFTTTTSKPEQEDHKDHLLIIIILSIVAATFAAVLGAYLIIRILSDSYNPTDGNVSGLSQRPLPSSPRNTIVSSGQELPHTSSPVDIPIEVDENNNPTIVQIPTEHPLPEQESETFEMTPPIPEQAVGTFEMTPPIQEQAVQNSETVPSIDTVRMNEQLNGVVVRRTVDEMYKKWIEVNLLWFSHSTGNIDQVRIFAHEIVGDDDKKMREQPREEKQCAIFYEKVRDAGFRKIHVVINALQEAGQDIQANELKTFFNFHCPSNPAIYDMPNITGTSQDNPETNGDGIVSTHNITIFNNSYTINNFYNDAQNNSARHSY